VNADSVRAYCLSFPQAKETLQWGETLCFKTGGKIFAMLSLGSVPPSLCFKCTPETFAELCEHEGIRPAPYVGRYKWVLLERLDVLGDEEIEDLIRQSHEMVTPTGKAKVKVKARVKKSRSRSRPSKHSSTSLPAGAKHKGRRRKES
jgi:predicted DNA-binding protein (MmcQ/YjbR family)